MSGEVDYRRRQLRRMRLVSVVEGTTLLVLLLIAVPLKYGLGYRMATSVVGPVHGIVFVLYVWMLIQTVASGGWSRREAVWVAIAAFVPFGAFANERTLRRKAAALGAE